MLVRYQPLRRVFLSRREALAAGNRPFSDAWKDPERETAKGSGLTLVPLKVALQRETKKTSSQKGFLHVGTKSAGCLLGRYFFETSHFGGEKSWSFRTLQASLV